MTQQEQLEAILDDFKIEVIMSCLAVQRGASDEAGMAKNAVALTKAQSAITALIQEAVKEGRAAELKQIEPPEQFEEFAKLAGHDACRICGFNAVKFRHHILDRIKQLNSGGSNNDTTA